MLTIALTVQGSAAGSYVSRRLAQSRGATAEDEVGPGHSNGIYVNRPALGARGAIAGDRDAAVRFNGLDQHIRVPVGDTGIASFGSTLEDFTVEFWYKSTERNPARCVLGTINKDGTDTMKTAIQVESNGNWFNLLFRSEKGNMMHVHMGPEFSGRMRDGNYHHAVWVVTSASQGAAGVYLDGERDTQSSVKGAAPGGFADFEHDLAIGATNDRGAFIRQHVKATLDDLALYPVPLSPSRIRAHFESARSGGGGYAGQVLSDRPAAYWRLGDSPERGLFLLLDDRVVETTENAALRVGAVVKHPANPLFGEEHPWEVMFNNMYPNVIYDQQEQVYKLWYSMFTVDAATTGVPREKRKPGTYMQHIGGREDGEGYATSKDGLAWEKPMMNVVPWTGKPSNLVSRHHHGAGVFKDRRERDPARRYKMFCAGRSTMLVCFSPDGVYWNPYAVACPEIGSPGDTHNNALWVPEVNRYVGFTRLRGHGDERLVARTESTVDFVNWTKCEEVLRGSPSLQTYSMPVFRYAGLYLGLPAMFDTEQDRVWTGLAWSPDSMDWRHIDQGTPLVPNAPDPGAYDWGTVYASVPVVQDDGIRLYYGGSNRGHYDWRDGFLCLATLRPDGFAGYQPETTSAPAVVTTRPLRIGSRLRITADAAGGSVTVSVLNETGTAAAVSDPVTADVTDGGVTWAGGALPAGIAGRRLRLRFVIDNAKLYSFLL